MDFIIDEAEVSDEIYSKDLIVQTTNAYWTTLLSLTMLERTLTLLLFIEILRTG